MTQGERGLRRPVLIRLSADTSSQPRQPAVDRNGRDPTPNSGGHRVTVKTSHSEVGDRPLYDWNKSRSNKGWNK